MGEPTIGGWSAFFVIFAISVWMAFSDRILHTEIEKVAKTDLELDEPAISVWMARPEAVRKAWPEQTEEEVTP